MDKLVRKENSEKEKIILFEGKRKAEGKVRIKKTKWKKL